MSTQATLPSPETRTTYDGPMTWPEVCAHPALRDLPFRIETNARGQIVMSPTSNQHSLMQAQVERLLEKHLGEGRAFPECSVITADGVKVADVVWASHDFLERHREEFAFSVAPEICVEVRSPSNTDAETEEKITLYLAKGAREVWLCDLGGTLTFFSHEGLLERSRLAPDVPSHLDT